MPVGKKIYVLCFKKSLKINPDAIWAKLDAVNGDAIAFTITASTAVTKVAERAEQRLSDIPVDLRIGTVVSYRPGGPVARSYRSPAISTRISLERDKKGWYLTEAVRDVVSPRQDEMFTLTTNAHAAQRAAEVALWRVGWSLDGLDKARQLSDKAALDAALSELAP